jgi:small GTP-binding protein
MDKIIIAIVGNSGCGKTTLINKYVYGNFTRDTQATVGLDFFRKDVLIDERKIQLQIYDTAGQEKFRSLSRSYYQKAHGIILTFDITLGNSFDSLELILQDIKYYNPKAELILVSTKHDLPMSKLHDKFKMGEFIKNNDLLYYQTSSRFGTNIDQIFKHLAKNILNREKEFTESGINSFSLSLEKTRDVANYWTYGYC